MPDPSAPTRISADLFAEAQIVAPLQDRSAAGQINHWARLGQAIEQSKVSASDLAAVLAGEQSYDSVDEFTQAAVRVAWDEGIDERRESLDMEALLRAEGQESWVSSGPDGAPVIVPADEGA